MISGGRVCSKFCRADLKVLLIFPECNRCHKVKKRADKNSDGQRSIKAQEKAPKKATPAARKFTKVSIGRLAEQVINASHQQNSQHNVFLLLHSFLSVPKSIFFFCRVGERNYCKILSPLRYFVNIFVQIPPQAKH